MGVIPLAAGSLIQAENALPNFIQQRPEFVKVGHGTREKKSEKYPHCIQRTHAEFSSP